jgi:hypothetical protein
MGDDCTVNTLELADKEMFRMKENFAELRKKAADNFKRADKYVMRR